MIETTTKFTIYSIFLRCIERLDFVMIENFSYETNNKFCDIFELFQWRHFVKWESKVERTTLDTPGNLHTSVNTFRDKNGRFSSHVTGNMANEEESSGNLE